MTQKSGARDVVHDHAIAAVRTGRTPLRGQCCDKPLRDKGVLNVANVVADGLGSAVVGVAGHGPGVVRRRVGVVMMVPGVVGRAE